MYRSSCPRYNFSVTTSDRSAHTHNKSVMLLLYITDKTRHAAITYTLAYVCIVEKRKSTEDDVYKTIVDESHGQILVCVCLCIRALLHVCFTNGRTCFNRRTISQHAYVHHIHATSDQVRLPAEFKHIIKRRKRN